MMIRRVFFGAPLAYPTRHAQILAVRSHGRSTTTRERGHRLRPLGGTTEAPRRLPRFRVISVTTRTEPNHIVRSPTNSTESCLTHSPPVGTT
jgi:hypothetical protein